MRYDSGYFDSHISGWHRATFPAISAFALRALGEGDQRRILDLGCGDGIYGPVLRTKASELVGVDASGEGLERAGARGVYDRLERADLSKPDALAALGSFDAVFSTEVIEHLEDFEAALRGARAALRPGGKLVVTTTMYYHYLFHGLVVQRAALRGTALLDYVGGLFARAPRARFLRRFWDYTGGHHHGFSRRQLTRALSAAGFEVEAFEWLYAGQVVPTFSLDNERERFARRGPHVALVARAARALAHAVNRGVERLHLPGPNCMIVARAGVHLNGGSDEGGGTRRA